MADPVDPFLQALLDAFANQQPAAAFNAQFSPLMGSRNQGLANYARGLQGQYYNDFLGRLLSDPQLKWTDYLKTRNPLAEFEGLTPGQRGEQPGRFAPNVQWLERLFS